MMNHPIFGERAGVTTLAFGLFLAVPSLSSATTWTVGPSGNFSTLSAAVTNASVVNGDTLMVAPGVYGNGNGLASPTTAQRQTLTLNKQLTIIGSGIGQTTITHTAAPATDTPCINITAPNVTIRDLDILYGNGETASIYRGVGATMAAASILLERVHFQANYARRNIFVNNGATNPTIRDCVFAGNQNREGIDINNISTASPGTLTIEGNTFAQSFFQQGPILFDGASGPNVVIRRNFFISRVGSFDSNPGDGLFNGPAGTANYGFQGDGSLLYNIFIGTLTTGRTVLIDNNTFVFRDGSTLNFGNAVPQIKAIQTETLPNYGAGGSPLTITDNIFQGYKADEALQISSQGAAFSFQPSGGVFGGSVELDGINGIGEFLSNAALNVGPKGTLSVWVKLDNIAKRNQILEGPNNDAGMEFQYRNNTGGQYFIRPYGGSEFTIQNGSAGNTNWTLVQYTWDQSAAVSRIYTATTGTAVAESAYLAGFDQNHASWLTPTDTTTGTFAFANDPSDSSRRFDGRIDDMAIFNDVLSPAELESIRTGGAVTFSADSRLKAHWRFDESSGNVAASDLNSLNITLQDTRSGITGLVIEGNGTPTVSNNLYHDNETVFLQGPTDGNPFTGNPLFANTGTTPQQIYLPLSGSPAIGNATDGGTIGAVSVLGIANNTVLNTALSRRDLILSGSLLASDGVTPASSVVFTVTTPPTFGTLSASTFTQADINNRLVHYTNTTTATADIVGLSVGNGSSTITLTYNITIAGGRADGDRDGLTDTLEALLGTNAASKDSDGDGIEDGIEVGIGTNPLSAASPGANTDSDGDLIPDAFDASPANADANSDRFRDGYALARRGNAAASVTLGDVNNSGTVEFSDGIALLRSFVGLSVLPADVDQDVNRDGFIDNADGAIIINWFLNNIQLLPFPK